MNETMNNYEAPLVEDLEVEVEKGFAVSGGSGDPRFTPFGPEDDWG